MNRVVKRAAALTAGLMLMLGCGSGARDIPGKEVRAAIRERIQSESDVLSLVDPRSGERVDLSFEEVHEGVKRTEGGRYFACVDFLGDGTPYDVDYYVNPLSYAIEDVVMHKAGGQSVLSADERTRLDSAR